MDNARLRHHNDATIEEARDWVAESNGGKQAARSAQKRQPLTGSRSLSGMQTSRTPEYLVIGHICGDIHANGKVVLGGTALYSALTAARLGWRTAVLTRGVYGREVEGYEIPSLEEYAGELQIIVQDADTTTMFVNEYTGGRRTQKLPHWAGQIDLRGLPPHWRNARIIHLGPIAQEIDPKQTGALTPYFLGATPQGWMRDWPKPGRRQGDPESPAASQGAGQPARLHHRQPGRNRALP